MNINVGLCKNNNGELDEIKKHSKLINEKHNISFIDFFTDEELYKYLDNNKLDICFLDTSFCEKNIIEIAKNVRIFNNNCMIIFIAENGKYAVDAFRARVFYYLTKPITIIDYAELFKEITNRIEELEEINKWKKELHINNKDTVFKIKYDKIFYFEKRLRKIRVVYEGNIIEYYGCFKDLYKILDKSCFIQRHQSFIVNSDKLYEYNNQMLYLDGCKEAIPVSKACIRNIRNKMTKLIDK